MPPRKKAASPEPIRVEATKARLSVIGETELLMHNQRMADPLDPFARGLKKISGKRTKTDADHWEMARIEFLGGVYWNPDTVGFYIPGPNIWKMLIEAAKITKKGKEIKRSILVPEDEIPLVYDGPRTPEERWEVLGDQPNERKYAHRMTVKVGQSRVVRTRPKFHEWSLTTDILVNSHQLDFEQLETIVANAGPMEGLGDYRPTFGRFRASVEKID